MGHSQTYEWKHIGHCYLYQPMAILTLVWQSWYFTQVLLSHAIKWELVKLWNEPLEPLPIKFRFQTCLVPKLSVSSPISEPCRTPWPAKWVQRHANEKQRWTHRSGYAMDEQGTCKKGAGSTGNSRGTVFKTCWLVPLFGNRMRD